jgi:hypothetical protein
MAAGFRVSKILKLVHINGLSRHCAIYLLSSLIVEIVVISNLSIG